MKKIFLLIAVATVLLTECKTTEENYRKSYEATIAFAKEKDMEGMDSETYNKVIASQRPKAVTVKGTDVPMTTGYAVMFNGDNKDLKKYNVVVGAMRQQFNAKAFCNRLKEEAGCNAYIMTDRDHNYFVVAAAFNNLEMAAEYLQNIGSHIKFKLPIDQPYIYDTKRIFIKEE